MDACFNCFQQFGLISSIDASNTLNRAEEPVTIPESLAKIDIKTFNNKIVLPFSLKCDRSHLICHLCLIKIDNQTINCPTCSIRSNIAEVKLDSASFLANLKQNQKSILQVECSINDLLTDRQSEDNKKQIKETISRFISRCCHCDTKDNYAEIFCPTCETITCKACVSKHQGHNVLPLGKIDFEKLNCHYHRNEKAEMFCAKEKIFICTRCLVPDGHMRHKYFSFYDSKIIRLKLTQIESLSQKLRIRNIQELAILNETIKFLSNSDKSEDIQKVRDMSKKTYEISQSNSIIDSMLGEIRLMLASPDYKIIYVPSEEKSLELESLIKSYFAIASSAVQPNGIEDALMPIEMGEQNIAPTPQLSPIPKQNGPVITNTNRQRLQPPRRLSSRPKFCQETKPNNIEPSYHKPDENNNPQYQLFTDNEFTDQTHIEFRLCKVVSPDEIWLVPGLRVKLLDKIIEKHKKFENQLLFSEEEAQSLSVGQMIGYKSEKHDHVYRARIVDKKVCEDGSILFDVQGADNCKKIAIKMDRLRKLIKDYKDLPQLKIKCSLNNLKPYESSELNSEAKWTSNSSLVAKKWLIDHQKNISLKIIGKIDNEYKVDFVAEWPHDCKTMNVIGLYNLNPSYLSDVLVKYKLAMREKNEELQFFKPSQKQPQFIPMMAFSPGDQVKATVTSFNSLKGFYLKRNYEDDPDDQLSKRLYQQINFEYQSNSQNYAIIAPEENLPCAALYQDKNWHRAEIRKIYPLETKVDVFFVDYGESYTLDCSNICYLRYEFLVSEVSTFKCRLFGIEFLNETAYENANQYAHDIFAHLVNSENKILDIVVKNTLQDGNSKIYEVVLRYKMGEKMENLNVMLTKLGFAQCTNLSIYDGEKEMPKVKDKHILKRAPKMTILEKSAQKAAQFSTNVQHFKPESAILCKVLNAESPDQIWVQDVIDSDQIYEQFHSKLNQHYSSLINGDQFTKAEVNWKIGDCCVIKKCNRSKFHRAQVVETWRSKYKVICVDLGQYELAEESNMFQLEKEFVQPGFMAKECFISGITPTGTSDGQWTSLAKEFVSTSLKDQYVYVDFLSQNASKHEVCVYVSAGRRLMLQNEPNDEKYVKFSDVLNTEGLALVSGRNSTIDQLISEANFLSKLGQVCTGCYGHPDLPKKVYKNFQNNYQVFYDCLVTDVGHENNHYYVWTMFPTLTNCLETFGEMSQGFEVFYAKNNSATFSADYLAKSSRAEACVCKIGSKFYRGEILKKENSADSFMVRLIDTGKIELIGADSIFKPLEKYIEVERLVYQVTLDTDQLGLDDQILSDLRHYLCNKMVKLKITRIINQEEDEDEKLYLTGEVLFSENQEHFSQIINRQVKDNSICDHVPNIPKSKVPSILHQQKHRITITWLENGDKAWFHFVFNDDHCIDELVEFKKNWDLFNQMQNEFLRLKNENRLNNIRIEDLKENSLCCCLYQLDMQLYRGLVKQVDYLEQTAEIFYFDFGNMDTVPFKQIYELDQSFKQVPVQAIEFKIRNREEFSDKNINDICLEAEFYLDKPIPELKINQLV